MIYFTDHHGKRHVLGHKPWRMLWRRILGKSVVILILSSVAAKAQHPLEVRIKEGNNPNSPVTVTGNGVFTVTPSTNAFSINGISFYRQDNYTATGNGTTVNVSSSPLRTFSIQVTGTPASATSWDVRLEGSLDGTNFTELMRHTEATGNGQDLFSGTNLQPILYLRSRCAALVLAPATSIAVIILGVQ